MDDCTGRVLAGRYRLPRLPSDAYDLVETRALDTWSGHEVVLRQIPLPEVVEAEVVDPGGRGAGSSDGGGARRSADPAVQRALEAAQAVAALPDHPRLDQVFDVFTEGGDLWIAGEQVRARPLAALLAAGPVTPHRAAEIAADVLTALRALHVHGWVHRNITARTVLVCEDGRAVLTGLAAGAAEEALCGYDPMPRPPYAPEPGGGDEPDSRGESPEPPRGAGPADDRAARAGAIAAYREGVRAGTEAAGTGSAPGRLPAPRREPAPVPAGTAQAADRPAAAEPPASGSTARWDDLLRKPPAGPETEGAAQDAEPGVYRGPETQLAAERARQARIITVGAVTERWAPEQAGPVHAHWRLAPPVGPATDLWALGALLFRAVQGHPPYPEDDAAELVDMVCAEPPAFAEECGPLRPIVESLLRQDPHERPDIEELRGWLRSLVRSAPEPEAGLRTVTVPPLEPGASGTAPALAPGAPGAPGAAGAPAAAKPRRLPVLRRRGDVVRRNRPPAPAVVHGRHKRTQQRRTHPRLLGVMLVGLVLLLVAGAMAFAAFVLPRDGSDAGGAGSPGSASQAPSTGSDSAGDGGQGGGGDDGEQTAQSTAPADLAEGFAIRKDPAGFQLAVREGWTRRGENARGQIRYLGDDGCELIVVPGRDTVAEYGSDPMAYQQDKQRELAPFRESSWSSASGLRRIDVGRTAMAEGTFTWKDSSGRDVHARNSVMILGGRYHVVLVLGPSSRSEDVDRYFEQASTTYRTTG